jgi:hypothetical protein
LKLDFDLADIGYCGICSVEWTIGKQGSTHPTVQPRSGASGTDAGSACRGTVFGSREQVKSRSIDTGQGLMGSNAPPSF